MLFDLRSRGRRRTVQVIYLLLALLMLSGLVLFGVGAGNGIGGLLNAFTGNGTNNAGSQAANQVTKAATRQTQLHPTDPSAWASLVQADWTAAGQGSNYNSSTSTYTASGKQQLRRTVQAWDRYLQLVKTPNFDIAILAGEAYAELTDYSNEATAWQYVASAQPSSARAFECVALASYAAKETRVGDLAAAKAVGLVPKLQKLTLKQELQAAKTQPTLAQQC